MGIANLAIPREKHQGVAIGLLLEFPQCLGDAVDVIIGGVGVINVILGRRILLDRTIANLDWIGPAGNLNDRSTTEVLREGFRIDGGGGDDDLQVRSRLSQPL